ncbi:MAG: TRASH domain-containing protein [Clostridia bacterium]|nr:TRASH domain-containing protein [Clostridia bacterium]
MEKLNLGVAYHGNRMLKHVKDDMRDIVAHNMNLVVHMFTHNDMKRHKNVMKEIFDVTKDYGLDFWVDNWGLGGPPGDVSHILQYFPDAHQVYSDGSIDPVRVCFNSPDYLKFTKEWLDMVKECGGDKIFWDEPHLTTRKDGVYACCCPTCKRLFEEKYGKAMPETSDEQVREFQCESMASYFEGATRYAKDLGMENIVCLMTVSESFTQSLMRLPAIDDVGNDPYWIGSDNDPYGFVYEKSKLFLDTAQKFGKRSHIWLQTYANKAGFEDEIYMAAEAAYDAGARNILAWSFRGGEACDYKAENCDMVWNITGDAMRRLKDRYLDEMREEKRKLYRK